MYLRDMVKGKTKESPSVTPSPMEIKKEKSGGKEVYSNVARSKID